MIHSDRITTAGVVLAAIAGIVILSLIPQLVRVRTDEDEVYNSNIAQCTTLCGQRGHIAKGIVLIRTNADTSVNCYCVQPPQDGGVQ